MSSSSIYVKYVTITIFGDFVRVNPISHRKSHSRTAAAKPIGITTISVHMAQQKVSYKGTKHKKGNSKENVLFIA